MNSSQMKCFCKFTVLSASGYLALAREVRGEVVQAGCYRHGSVVISSVSLANNLINKIED